MRNKEVHGIDFESVQGRYSEMKAGVSAAEDVCRRLYLPVLEAMAQAGDADAQRDLGWVQPTAESVSTPVDELGSTAVSGGVR